MQVLFWLSSGGPLGEVFITYLCSLLILYHLSRRPLQPKPVITGKCFSACFPQDSVSIYQEWGRLDYQAEAFASEMGEGKTAQRNLLRRNYWLLLEISKGHFPLLSRHSEVFRAKIPNHLALFATAFSCRTANVLTIQTCVSVSSFSFPFFGFLCNKRASYTCYLCESALYTTPTLGPIACCHVDTDLPEEKETDNEPKKTKMVCSKLICFQRLLIWYVILACMTVKGRQRKE